MAEQTCDKGATATETVLETEETDGQPPRDAPTLRLKLKKPKSDKKVKFDATTVDNENLGRKKSKCCCIYTKPVRFGESSSESEDECENCYGHVETRHKGGTNDPGPSSDSNCSHPNPN